MEISKKIIILALAYLSIIYSTNNINNTPKYLSFNNYSNPVAIWQNINPDWLLKNIFNNNVTELQNWLAKVNIKNYINGFKWTLLHEASSSGFYSLVKEILKEEPDLNILDHKRRTALHIAIKNKHIDIAELLIKSEASLEIRDSIRCETPLFYAINNNLPELIELLISYGAKINTVNSNQQTPLHIAVLHNNINLVEYLIKNGADTDIKDQDGYTCADLALQEGYTELAKTLILTYKVKFSNNDGIKRNITYNNIPIINLYLRSTPDTSFTFDYDNIYRLALINNRIDIAKILTDFFWNKVDYHFKSLMIDWTIILNQHEVLSYILNKLDIADLYQITLIKSESKMLNNLEKIITSKMRRNLILEKACDKGNHKIALALLAIGANKNGFLNLRSRNTSLSPLYCAIKKGHIDIIKLLLKHRPCPYVILDRQKENVLYLKEVTDNPIINQIIEEYKNKQATKIQNIVQKNYRCIICLELAKEKVKTECCHQLVHEECWNQALNYDTRCPNCRRTIRDIRSDEEVITEDFICNLINIHLSHIPYSANTSNSEILNELNNILYYLNLYLQRNFIEEITIDDLYQLIKRATQNIGQTRIEVTRESLILAIQELVNNNYARTFIPALTYQPQSNSRTD